MAELKYLHEKINNIEGKKKSIKSATKDYTLRLLTGESLVLKVTLFINQLAFVTRTEESLLCIKKKLCQC